MSNRIIPNREVCYICGKKAENRERDINREWTGKYLCKKHYNKNYDNNVRINDPNSKGNILKSICNCRTCNQDPKSALAKGALFEELTVRWRGIKNLNKEYDNYRTPIDHSRDPELGVIDTMGRFYNPINKRWSIGFIDRYHNKEINNIIFYGANEDGNLIERIYIFPKEELIKRTGITICFNPIGWQRVCERWYEKYRVDDEIKKYVNNIYQQILKEKGGI